jgi:type I restriction enzyme S subunit
MVRTQDIRQGFYNTQDAVKVSEESYIQRTKRAKPQNGDLLFSREGTYFGDAAEIPENTDLCLGQRMVLLRPCQKIIDPTFLRIWINSQNFQNYLLAFRDGTVAERLNLSTIRKLPIPVPDQAIQSKIISLITPLEKKIELNRRMNATLEGLAQALFQNWFVDFDPVLDNALAAGNPIPDELTDRAAVRRQALDNGTANRETAQHFPATFQFTEELGWIPEGWEAVKIEDFVDIKHGFAFKGKYFCDEPTSDILLTPGNFHIGGGFKGSKLKYYEGPVEDEYVLDAHDLIVTMTDLSKAGDTLGYPAFIPESNELRYLHNQRIGRILLKGSGVGKYLLNQIFRSKAYRNEVLSSMSGSTVKHTSPSKIQAFTFPFSGGHLENYLEKECEATELKISHNNQENITLTKLRDTLLPQLISGELRIPDAAKITEAALA